MPDSLLITGPIQGQLHQVVCDDVGLTGSVPVRGWLTSLLAGAPYSLAAIQGLTGQLPRLFGRPPLLEVVDYTDAGPVPAPQIDRLVPESIAAGGADVTVHVSGRGFTPRAQIVFNGGAETTTFVSTTELTTTVVGATATTPGAYPVQVTTPGPGGGTTGARWFYVLSPDDLTVVRHEGDISWEVPVI